MQHMQDMQDMQDTIEEIRDTRRHTPHRSPATPHASERQSMALNRHTGCATCIPGLVYCSERMQTTNLGNRGRAHDVRQGPYPPVMSDQAGNA